LAREEIIAEQKAATARGEAEAQIERARGEAESNRLVAVGGGLILDLGSLPPRPSAAPAP
jgi:glycerol dehydrogenase-like iron-containing ADH family enzyme